MRYLIIFLCYYFFASVQVQAQQAEQNLEVLQSDSLFFTTIRGDTVDVSSLHQQGNITILVFNSQPACRICFVWLGEFLSEVADSLNFSSNLYVIAPNYQSIIEKRNAITDFKHKFKYSKLSEDLNTYLFDITEIMKQSHFLDATPSLLVLKDGNTIFLPYAYIFAAESGVSEKAKAKIRELFSLL
ncbi:MAG: hypothetical protein JJT94_03950 [Bernardetiaceae bacterium]|nr:hypothetical protein [Bernardetiaceae bacterium]